MAQHFGRIGAMANGRIPFDAKAAADNAEIVADMAKLPWAGFWRRHRQRRPDQGQGRNLDRSRPSSRKHSDKLIAESTKLAAAAKTGNLDALKTASLVRLPAPARPATTPIRAQ
jgi:cytochrome c556